MQFEAKTLSDSIAAHVESIFHYQAFFPDHSIERVIPTGHHYILLELDGITRHTYDPGSLEPNANFEQVWLSAVRKDHLSISAHQNSEMLVIQLKPYGGLPVLHQAMHQFADRVIPGDEILDGALLNLHKAVATAQTPAGKLKVAEDWVINRLNSDLAPPQVFIDLVDRLFAEPACPLADVTASYPASQKHLIDQFKRYVGVTPKVLQRIIRFNEILKTIQESKPLVWSDIANLCGFSDQSHFIREFKMFSGLNPGEFIDRGFDDQEPNFFPLDSVGED